MSFLIGGLQKNTFLDFPQKIACIVFAQKCNFHCGYCHNPELHIQSKPAITEQEFFEFLKTRRRKLDGVVITGGEPTLQAELFDFITQIKDMGYLIKLDTNGYKPEVLTRLTEANLVNYIAMDIKAPLDKYYKIAGTNIDTNKITESISLIKNSRIDYEFRTTVVKSQLAPNDFEKIGQLINGAKRYYLQKFVPTKTLDLNFKNEDTYTDEEFKVICSNLKKYADFVDFR